MPIRISNITGTFSNSLVRYDGIGLNINAVAYAANSNLFHLRRDDETKFRVDLNGNLILSGSITANGVLVGNGGSNATSITINPKDYGAAGDGVTDDRDAFAKATSVAAGLGAVLEIGDGTYLIDSDLSLVSPIRFSGGILKPTSANIITISEEIEASERQIFDISVGGIFEGTGASGGIVYQKWFGGIGDGSSDNAAATAAALHYLSGRTSAGVYGGILQFGLGKFVHNSGVVIDFPGCVIRGTSALTSYLVMNGNFDMFFIEGAVDGSGAAYGTIIEHLSIDSNEAKPTSGKMLYFERAQEFVVRNCRFLNPYLAIHCYACGGPLVKEISSCSFVAPSTVPAIAGSSLLFFEGDPSPVSGTGLNERFVIQNNTGGGIGIDYGVRATGLDVFKFTGNHFHGAATAQLAIDATNCNCYNVQSQGNVWEGLDGYALYTVWIKSNAGKLTNSFAFANDEMLNGVTSSVRIEGADVNGVSFVGCHIMQPCGDGVVFDGGTNLKVVGCEFTDCNISGGSTKSFVVIGNGSTGPTNVLVADNTFARKFFLTYDVTYGIYVRNSVNVVLHGNLFKASAVVQAIEGAIGQFGTYSLIANNTGIGIHNPAYKLHVYENSNSGIRTTTQNPNTGSGSYVMSSVENATGQMNMQLGVGGDATIYNTSSNYMFIYTSQSGYPLYLGSGGNVKAIVNSSGLTVNGSVSADSLSVTGIASSNTLGVGIASPSYKFHVYENSNAIMRSVTQNANTGSGSYAISTVTNPQGEVNVQLGPGGDATFYSTTGNYMFIYTNQATPLYLGANGSIKMTVAANGNIGLANQNPTHTLDVNGNVAILSNTLVLGTSSIAANGYSRLPNGLLMQWGSVVSNTSVGDITFPVGFTTLYSITYSANVSGAYNSTYLPLTIASNTLTANVRTGNTTAKVIQYMAIGT